MVRSKESKPICNLSVIPEKDGLQQQQPQPVITPLQPAVVAAPPVNNTQQFLESGGMLTLPSNGAAVVREDSGSERTGNTDSGLYTSQY